MGGRSTLPGDRHGQGANPIATLSGLSPSKIQLHPPYFSNGIHPPTPFVGEPCTSRSPRDPESNPDVKG